MKIFLFDFDGVIIDTLPIAVQVYNELLLKYKIDITFSKQSFAKLFENNFHSSLKQIVPDEKIREKILKQRAQQYINRKDEFVVFDGIKTTLETIAKDNKIIIISSNRTNFIESLLQSRNINCISEVLGADKEKNKTTKIAWQKHKYPDSIYYYIGDTVGDIKEGKKSNVATVAVTWGFHDKKLLSKYKPDYIFDKPEELLSLI